MGAGVALSVLVVLASAPRAAVATPAAAAPAVVTAAATSVATAGGARPWARSTASVPTLPRGSHRLGPVPSATELHADVVLEPRDPVALEAFDTAVSTPGSASFRRYLAPGQFAGAFGPSRTTIAAVRTWLAGVGLAVGATAGDGLLVPVSGTATQLDRALGVGLDRYRLPSGRVVRSPSAPPLVPSALARAVDGVAGLDDLSQAVPELVRSSLHSTGAGATPTVGGATPSLVGAPVGHADGPVPSAGCAAAIEASGSGHGALTADELAEAYSFSGLYPGTEGSGVTVGIYELEPFLNADVNTFKACYTPAISATVNGIGVDRTNPNADAGHGEAALDIEMVIGMAPDVNAKVFVGPNGGSGPLDTYAAMVDGSNPPDVISTSWGQCEAQLSSAYIGAEASLFEQAVAQGQTLVAAAGDEGSEDCYSFPSSLDSRLEVDDPGSQPWVTSVGGTTLGALGPAPSETVWNSGLFAGSGGGGSSTRWTMPAWQQGPGVQSPYTKAQDSFTGAQPCPVSAGAGTRSCREVPDVASDADPHTGYAFFCSCVNGGWAKIGGTSMAAPLWSALAALADQGQSSTVGFMNPALYQAQCAGDPVFNDVTTGDNEPSGSVPSDPPHVPSGPYYPATPGYDLATGLGTPVADALVAMLQSPPADVCPSVRAVSVTSGPAAGGTTVTLTGANLSGVVEVDFGAGRPAQIRSVTSSSVSVVSPASPTGGWATADLIVKTATDALGFDGAMPFSYVGPRGYWTVASDGGVFAFGQMGFYGSMGGKALHEPIVGMAPTPDGGGYWLVASDGGVFAFGDAGFHGSTGNIKLSKPVVGMATTPDGGGYWLVASDGGVFAFGDAAFYGSTGNIKLSKPVVGMATTPDGGGYWLVASDGGVFAFGDAAFYGSTGNIKLAKPVVGMAPTPDGGGYWLVASDGGVFSFGDAGFHGSTGNIKLAKPVVGMAPTPDGGGYWLVASDGGVFAFGGTDGGFFGSTGDLTLARPMVGIGAP